VTTAESVSDLIRAKTLFATGEYTCVLVKGDSVLTSAARGVAPMIGFITEGVDLRGFSVADKVVGKAAALLFAKAEVGQVYAPLASHAAIDVLANAGIAAQFDTIVGRILKSDGTGPCPMEQQVAHTDDPDTAYTQLSAALAQMRAAAQANPTNQSSQQPSNRERND
jgi:hypothetical protein